MEEDILLVTEIKYGVCVNGELTSLFMFNEDAVEQAIALSNLHKYHSVEIKEVVYAGTFFKLKSV